MTFVVLRKTNTMLFAEQISTLRPKAEVVRFAGAYFDTCAHIHTIVKSQKHFCSWFENNALQDVIWLVATDVRCISRSNAIPRDQWRQIIDRSFRLSNCIWQESGLKIGENRGNRDIYFEFCSCGTSFSLSIEIANGGRFRWNFIKFLDGKL